jgi:hypothetical protein
MNSHTGYAAVTRGLVSLYGQDLYEPKGAFWSSDHIRHAQRVSGALAA